MSTNPYNVTHNDGFVVKHWDVRDFHNLPSKYRRFAIKMVAVKHDVDYQTVLFGLDEVEQYWYDLQHETIFLRLKFGFFLYSEIDLLNFDPFRMSASAPMPVKPDVDYNFPLDDTVRTLFD